MPKEKTSSIREKLKAAAPLSDKAHEALIELPFPLQMAYLRQHYKITQTDLASALGVKQAYFSRLEIEDSDHLVSQYQKVARLLNAKVVLLPLRSKISQRR